MSSKSVGLQTSSSMEVTSSGSHPVPLWLGSTSAATVDRFGRPLWLDTDQGIIEATQRIAEASGVSMAQVGLAWA